jgi:membrane protein YqaA with SNARE-associated domain
MIKKLYDKCVKWAAHKYANHLLAFVAFIESSFFPIPPDVMIIPMTVAKKEKFLKIALITTIFSVLGALFGYFIGYVFFNEVGIKIFEIYGYEDPNFLKEKFSTKGGFVSWLGILFTAGFTPLPFKLLTISSGFIHFNIFFFIIICIVTRGSRFFLVAFLTYKYGELFGPFLEKKGGLWSIIIAGIIIVLAAGIYFVLLK